MMVGDAFGKRHRVPEAQESYGISAFRESSLQNVRERLSYPFSVISLMGRREPMLGTFRYFRCEPLTHASIGDGDGKYAPIYSKSYGDPELGEVGPRPTFLESTEERRVG